MLCYRSAPITYAALPAHRSHMRGPAFGKIGGDIEIARSSRKFAYGGKRSENRADSPKGGPPHFRDLPLCRAKARIIAKNVETLD